MEKMKRRDYEKPTTLVVELRQQAPLICTSTGVQNYTVNEYIEE